MTWAIKGLKYLSVGWIVYMLKLLDGFQLNF